ENGDTLEKARQMAAHAATRITQLYDRREDRVTLDEVVRINIRGEPLQIGNNRYGNVRPTALVPCTKLTAAAGCGSSCLALRNNPHAGILSFRSISALVARARSITNRLSWTIADPNRDCCRRRLRVRRAVSGERT